MDDTAAAPPTDEDLNLIAQAMASGLSMADAAGVDKRAMRAVIWHAAITALLEFASPDLAIAYLEDRAAAIKGYGVNGDSLIQTLNPQERDARSKDVPLGAEIVYEHVGPAIDIVDDRDRDGISAFVHAAFAMLKDLWGPVHLRRIVLTQVKALRAGTYAPILPAEPVQQNKPKNDAAALPRPRASRAATIVVLIGDRSFRWVLTAEISEHASDRKENRTISGSAKDRTEAVLALADALLSLIGSIAGQHPDDRIKIVTDLPSAPLLGGELPHSLQERLASVIADRRIAWPGPGESQQLIEKTKKALDAKA